MYKQNSHSRWIGSADYFKVCSPQKINNHNHSVSADLHLCDVCMLCFAVLIVIFSDSWLINCSMTSESKDSLPLTSYFLSDIVIYNNTQTSADITHRLFSTPCWFESVPWTDSPLLCLESILCLLPHIWEEKKKSKTCFLSSICCRRSSFHSSTLFYSIPSFCSAIVVSRGRASPLNCNAKIKAWVKEKGSIIWTSCKLRKGKSHPSCFHVLVLVGIHVDDCQWFWGILVGGSILLLH